MKGKRVLDFIFAHPILDQAIPVVLFLIWHFIFSGQLPGDASLRSSVYIGLSAVSGIVLAAGTFVCAVLYQSMTPTVVALRAKYSPILLKNWATSFVLLFLAAMLPLGSGLFSSTHAAPAFGVALYALGVLLASGFRTYLWLVIAFMLEGSPEPPERSDFETRLKRRPR